MNHLLFMHLTRTGLFVSILLLLISSGAYAQSDGFVSPPTAENFISLFNGTDLSGWVEMGEPGAFVAENGTLFLKNPHNYPNWLRSEKRYENFILKLEYQIPGWSETGIYLHAPLYGKPWKSGIKIHLRHDRLEEGARSTGAIYDVRAPITMANKTGEAWNELTVYMNWPRLRVTLNDTLIQDVNMERSAALRWRLRKGYIGFEDSGTQIRYRNIQIKELPPTEEEWTLLLAGQDLSAWQEEGEADWMVEDGTLIAQGNNGLLVTKESFDAFEFQTYFKTSPHANGGIFYRVKDRAEGQDHYEIQIYNVPTATNPTGSIYGLVPASESACQSGTWCFLQIISDGAYTRVLVNGETVAEATHLSLPDGGRIALQSHSQGTIEYKMMRIKPLASE